VRQLFLLEAALQLLLALYRSYRLYFEILYHLLVLRLYELEDGRTLVFIDEGLINDIKSQNKDDMIDKEQVVAEEQPQGEKVAAPAPTDMGMDDVGDDAGEEAMDMDDFGGDASQSGEDNPVGRELKGESAIANMERGALAEKKFLESKDKLFKMVESGTMSQEHFINIISELDLQEKDPYGQKQMDTRTLNTGKLMGIEYDPNRENPKGPKGSTSSRQFEPLDNKPINNLDNKRGFTPGQQVPPANLQNKRGFTPGQQVPPANLQNKRGFTPGQKPQGKAKPTQSINKGGLRTADLRKGDLGFDAMQSFVNRMRDGGSTPEPGPKPMRFGGMARLKK
jgi:hypothetical protein